MKRPGREEWALAAAGAGALAPLLVYHRQFAQLFWFGDDFDQVDLIDRTGFWHWFGVVFAENFVPVFKLAFGLVLFGTRGSYPAFIALLWLAHAANVVLLGRVMRTAGLSWTAVLFAQIVFGLTPSSLETLGWGTQLSAVLACAFMLPGLDLCLRARSAEPPFPAGTAGATLGWSAASALSFSRGVLTGPALALGSLWPGGGPLRRRALTAAAALAPALVTAGLIKAYATGNHQHMQGHWGEAAAYGLWYWCLNPSVALLGVESWGWHTTAALGALKLALVSWALARSRGPARLLFAILVAFDLGNAVLLGIGRYHTGLGTTTSSRYQYASLIAVLPLAGFFLERQLARVRISRRLRAAAGACLLGAASWLVFRGWPEALEPFVRARGSDSRRVLLLEASPADHAVPGIPFMTTARARELIRKYGLH